MRLPVTLGSGKPHAGSVEQTPVERLFVIGSFENDEVGPRGTEAGPHPHRQRLKLLDVGIDRQQLLLRTEPGRQFGKLTCDAYPAFERAGPIGIWQR
jgi:hypothetical protein